MILVHLAGAQAVTSVRPLPFAIQTHSIRTQVVCTPNIYVHKCAINSIRYLQTYYICMITWLRRVHIIGPQGQLSLAPTNNNYKPALCFKI